MCGKRRWLLSLQILLCPEMSFPSLIFNYIYSFNDGWITLKKIVEMHAMNLYVHENQQQQQQGVYSNLCHAFMINWSLKLRISLWNTLYILKHYNLIWQTGKKIIYTEYYYSISLKYQIKSRMKVKNFFQELNILSLVIHWKMINVLCITYFILVTRISVFFL